MTISVAKTKGHFMPIMCSLDLFVASDLSFVISILVTNGLFYSRDLPLKLAWSKLLDLSAQTPYFPWPSSLILT